LGEKKNSGKRLEEESQGEKQPRLTGQDRFRRSRERWGELTKHQKESRKVEGPERKPQNGEKGSTHFGVRLGKSGHAEVLQNQETPREGGIPVVSEFVEGTKRRGKRSGHSCQPRSKGEKKEKRKKREKKKIKEKRKKKKRKKKKKKKGGEKNEYRSQKGEGEYGRPVKRKTRKGIESCLCRGYFLFTTTRKGENLYGK